MNSVIQLSIYSHQGLVRDHNEDAVGLDGWSFQGNLPQPLSLTLSLDASHLVAVCDGMGGHAGGATASTMAASGFTSGATDVDPADRHALDERMQSVSNAINTVSDDSRELHGLGTTIVAALVTKDGNVTIINVGDSRAYRLESGYLGQLSVDHRRAETNQLTQALGGGRRTIVEPAYFDCHLGEGGILLCTDGICDYVDELALEEEMARPSPVPLTERLVSLALDGGGGDNTTAVYIELAAASGAARGEPENREEL